MDVTIGTPESDRRGEGGRDSTPLPTRRNRPRASHACQPCRAKKGRCNQQQPCSNCMRHATPCVYGVRRSNAKEGRRRVDVRPSPGSDAQQDRDRGRDGGNGNHTDAAPVAANGSAANGFRSLTPTLRRSVTKSAANQRHPPNKNSSEASIQKSSPTHDRDGLGGINQHTHGTEFYGTSSNYVLLSQLFTYARLHLRSGHAGSRGLEHVAGSARSPRATTRNVSTDDDQNTPSVVNLLSTDEALAPSRARTPPSMAERDPSRADHSTHGSANRLAIPVPNSGVASRLQVDGGSSSHPPIHASKSAPAVSLALAERRLERELVRSFLHNLHYLHPMLDSQSFTARCNEEMWSSVLPQGKPKGRRHFVALYNIVVAVGALVASRDILEDLGFDTKIFEQSWSEGLDLTQKSFLHTLSRKYFRQSRAALGDVFEACSLESAQTLLLMSLYCQNSLKPHACYMYCGMAVRTALAIGLPTESMSCSSESRKAARKTWWCIYSHEIDMSCSSGRRDSLGKPRNYPLPLPRIKGQSPSGVSPEDEDHGVAMVSEMVHFAVLLRRISKEIYHDTKGLTVLQKSGVAAELDQLLLTWKINLPDWLNFDAVTFRGTEMAAKQKLVLHLRYLNARVLLHRPFLADLTCDVASIREKHANLCVAAARETIRLLYDSYATRPYFRTWWYNSTYTLYAGMIILYAIMLGHTPIPTSDLVDDVKKSRDILRSMEESSVARRSADLMSEVLDIARAYSQRERSAEPDVEVDLHVNEQQDHTPSYEGPHITDDLFSQEFDNADGGQDPEAWLASLIDSSMLQDFTAVDAESTDMDLSVLSGYGELGFPFSDSYNFTASQ